MSGIYSTPQMYHCGIKWCSIFICSGYVRFFAVNLPGSESARFLLYVWCIRATRTSLVAVDVSFEVLVQLVLEGYAKYINYHAFHQFSKLPLFSKKYVVSMWWLIVYRCPRLHLYLFCKRTHTWIDTFVQLPFECVCVCVRAHAWFY